LNAHSEGVRHGQTKTQALPELDLLAMQRTGTVMQEQYGPKIRRRGRKTPAKKHLKAPCRLPFAELV
jgi:hypothetical protein